MSLRRRKFHTLSDFPSGHVLNACRGWLAVIRPYARTNLVTNPSAETATTGYTAVGGSIARSTTEQYHGAYSIAVTPSAGSNSDGVFFGSVSLSSGTTYAYSCKVKASAGREYTISIATTGGATLTAVTFRATGRWQWVYGFWTETSSTSRRFYIRKNAHADANVFYVDGLQIEACGSEGVFPTTYIDGDQKSVLPAGQFPPPYGWTGTPHASTSYRTANTRDGGRVMHFDLFNLLITAVAGLGIATPSHIITQQGYADGANYQTSVVPSRELRVQARFNTRSDIQLKQSRAALGAALGLDATAPRQPLALFYQEVIGREPVGAVGKIIASLGQGMEGRWENTIGEDVDLRFHQWLPFIGTRDGGVALTQSETITVTNISNLMYRNASGDWSKLADFSGTDQVVDAIQHPDGTWYVTGAFTSIGGTSANRIARYDPVAGTFSALGTGLSGQGNRLFIDPTGNVYVGGNFATANGVTVNNITYWNGTTFVALGSGGTKGVNNTVFGVTMNSAGTLYVTGQFTQAGGSAAAGIASVTSGGTWAALSTGLTGSTGFGFGLTTGLNGTDIYVGGDFTTAGGVSAPDIAVWNGSAFAALGSSVNGDVRNVITAPNGDIYATGDFTTAGGVTVNYIARWNGTQWSALGQGITTATFANRMKIGFDGLLYVGGSFSAVNGITTADAFAAWNGSAWILPDVDMAGTPQAVGMAVGRRGELMVNFFNGTASDGVAAQLNTLTNEGTAVTYPVITITGPSSSTSRLHTIRSYTTGAILSFNLTIFANEIITITTGPDVISVTSNNRGNLTATLLPGSAPELGLLKGDNSISLLITGGTVTTVATWPEKVADASDLIYQ